MSKHFEIDEEAVSAGLQGDVLEPHVTTLLEAINTRRNELKHGKLPLWREALAALPALQVEALQLDQACITIKADVTQQQSQQLHAALMGLLPWRKGPFQVADQFIDCEWRSDWKWQRLLPHISTLEGRSVLDVGCGSGYHLWRMRGAGARLALGIDPGLLFLMQFQAIQFYANEPDIHCLPLTLETMPQGLACFDTVFSMGVLYHRREPEQHLRQLRSMLRAGGELVLETLIVAGEDDLELAIPDRYARMRNVWSLPSKRRLVHWLGNEGFSDVRVVSDAPTDLAEQRSTSWMPFESLRDSLDPNNNTLTIEGLPAPRRAIVIATPS